MTLLKIDIDDSTDVSNVILPKEYLDGLKETFKALVDFLNEHNIEYFIDGGTLLGCVRDKGQIPWDDDIDIGMTPSHYNKFRKLAQEFSKKGFQVDDFPSNVIKIINPQVAFIRTLVDGDTSPRYACIDIFLYVLQKKYYVLENKKFQKLYENSKYHKNELYPLKEYDYHDFKVKGTASPDEYLTRYYGDWKKRSIYIYK